ncbi:TetR/AcrR family transcriptional regulator [Limnochorda pilosa]|uniref:AcrR family transcriptional regulator n=1 Tax=Limnochorda pilosa TaxID=1555112 RepID=A0A0K2SMD7_LIMPI|nr:TetR/AcrR family transcriptional regulator [Limnochorda pilosa]BAS28157.1 AcrR family transcriptional regulator [Limnochorda pilosa]
MGARATTSTDQQQAIFEAAYACLAERGYAHVSMRDIARRAGVVLSQLHYYYQSKDGLFLHVMRQVTARHLEDVRRHLAGPAGTVHDKVTAAVELFRSKLRSDPALFRLLFDFTSLALWNTRAREELVRLYSDVSDLVEQAILVSKAEGHAPPAGDRNGISPRVVARLLLTTLYGAALQAMVTPEDAEMAEVLAGAEHMVLRMVGAQD